MAALKTQNCTTPGMTIWYHALAQPLHSTGLSRRLVPLSGTTSLLNCTLFCVICLALFMVS